MSKIDFDKMTRDFILGESKNTPSGLSYIQSLMEIVNSITPRTKTDAHRISMAKNHLREIRKNYKKLEEKVQVLEEKVKVLEEGK
tara:strand:+ start:2250 stop:2504 length:255 start_codon:yes stop_codon:yes gene_type:complete